MMRYKYLGIADRHGSKVYIDTKTKKIFYKHKDGTAEIVNVEDIHYLGRDKNKVSNSENYKYCYKKAMDKIKKYYKPSDFRLLGKVINTQKLSDIFIRFKYLGKESQKNVYMDRRTNKIYCIGTEIDSVPELVELHKCNKKIIKQAHETMETVSIKDMKIALLIIIIELIYIIHPKIENIIDNYKYEQHLQSRIEEENEIEVTYTTEEIIANVIDIINNNQNLSIIEKEYLKGYFIEYLKDYGSNLKASTIEAMFEQFKELDVKYKKYDGGSTLGYYYDDNITIYGNKYKVTGYPENIFPSTFFHEQTHDAFDHDKVPVGRGISLLEAYCGALQRKYTDSTSYVEEQEYLLVMSKILSVEEVNYYLSNVDLEGLKKSLSEKTNTSEEEISLLYAKMDEAYRMCVTDEYLDHEDEYRKLRYDISILLTELYLNSKPTKTECDIIIDNLLSKDRIETSFLDSSTTPLIYSYRTNTWYKSYIEYEVSKEDENKSKAQILSENASDFISYLYENINNPTAANILEIFMMICDEESLSVTTKDNFYDILKLNLNKYHLEETADEFILKYKPLMDKCYNIEEYYYNELLNLLITKYTNKEGLTLEDHADINRLKELIPNNFYTYYESFIYNLENSLIQEKDYYLLKYGYVKWVDKNLEEPLSWKIDENIELVLQLKKECLNGEIYYFLPSYLTEYKDNLSLPLGCILVELEDKIAIKTVSNNSGLDDRTLNIRIIYKEEKNNISLKYKEDIY